MPDNNYCPRIAVYVLPGSPPEQQVAHCTKVIAARHGQHIATFQFAEFQALFAAASAGQMDEVMADTGAIPPEHHPFLYLLGEVLWQRHGLCLHLLESPAANPISPHFQQLVEYTLLGGDDDSEQTPLRDLPLGYCDVGADVQADISQAEQVSRLVADYSRNEPVE